MQTDRKTLESLINKTPYAALKKLLENKRMQIYDTILKKFNIYFKKIQTDFQIDFICSKIHFHNTLNNLCKDNCLASEFEFESRDKALCIDVSIEYDEKFKSNDFMDSLYLKYSKFNEIILKHQIFDSDGRLSHTKEICKWSFDFDWKNRNYILICEPVSRPHFDAMILSEISSSMANAKKFCQYLCGIPLGAIAEDDLHNSQKTSPIGLMMQHAKELFHDYVYISLYYIKEAMYTILLIHQFRRDSIIATLPKDIVKIIVREIWKSRNDPLWTEL